MSNNTSDRTWYEQQNKEYWTNYKAEKARLLKEYEEEMRVLKLFPKDQEEMNDIVDSLEVMAKLMGYNVQKNETKTYRDMKIVKKLHVDDENWFELDWIVITVSKETSKVIVGYTGHDKTMSKRKTKEVLDNYKGEDLKELFSRIAAWL